ncbi:glycosyltransferase [Microbacterium oleivorans]|uniref:glycosyltransferase n=1 Tax=Microbacterium oleivorans TaxID=273677 RepID=UPI0013902793|nr:glycosyltransferase [Microbacterium oleivorans]
MKILFVAPWIPSVRRPRSLQILAHLQERHDVSFVGPSWNVDDEGSFAELAIEQKWTTRVGRLRGATRAFRALVFSRVSLQQAFVSDPRFLRTVRSAIAEVQPDLLFFNVSRSVQLREVAPNIPAVVDLDEYRSAYFRLLAQSSSNILLRWVSRIEAARIARSEARLPSGFARIFVSSPADLDHHDRVRLVRSTVDDPSDLGERRPSIPSIVFSGRQSYRANREAVIWFGKEILPGVVSSVPDAELTIVGADPPAQVRALAGPHVTVTGTVPEIRPYLEMASIAVIPVLHATGVQLKLLEAMAAGVPCVVTPVVARGAGIESGVHCLVADTPNEWISAVVRLLTDEILRERIIEAASLWLRTNHVSDVTREALLKEVESAFER